MSYNHPSMLPHDGPHPLRDLTNAMDYNNSGEPVVRVHVDGISLEGDVIVSNVTIDNPTTNPVNVRVNSGNVNANITGGTVTITDGGNSITVDGNVGVTGTVNATVTGGNINVSQTTSPWIVSGNVVTQPLLGGNDAFGRLRVSEPYTLGDYKHLYGLDPNFIDYMVNGGNIAFQNNQACARLSTTSNTSSRAVHQTKFYHHYMPGKSQMVLASFNFYNAVSNVTKRTGYFDDRYGGA